MADTLIPSESSSVVGIALELREYPVVPGGSVEISVTIMNLGTEEDHFELAVRGVPLSWISVPTPVVRLAAGGKTNLVVFIQVPPAPQSRAGHYPVMILATSQSNPDHTAEVEALLRVAAFEAQGRIGVMMQSIQFAVAPGSSVPVVIVLLNQGLASDEFRLSVEGIPLDWISTTSPVTHLEAGERKEVTLTIQPHRQPQSKAGRYPFKIGVSSQNSPEQSVIVECTLNLAVFTQFSAMIDPPQVEAGKPAQLTVANQGNAQDVFTLTWQSDNDQLIFEPGVTQSLRVGGGESGVAGFTGNARQRSIIGGDTIYKYTTRIQSSGKEVLTVGGEVVSRSMIPVWILPVVLILCLGVIALGAFLLGRGRSESGNGTQTAVAGTQTSTAMIGEFLAATQTAAFNMTQAAETGERDDDGDGLTNDQEAGLGTNPNNPDTDGDLLNDGDEVNRGTNPLDPDTDRDQLQDGTEVRIGTDPLNPDTDGDGIIDGLDLDPLDPNNPSLTATAVAGLPTATPVTPSPSPTTPPTVTPPAPPTVTPTQTIAPAPVRGVIAFESNRQGNPGIFAQNAADGSVTVLSLSSGTDTQPVYSPDGSLIAFTSNRDGNNEIYIMNANGSGQYNLTTNPGNDLYPSWSPDGQWIAFTSDRDGNQDIFIVRTDHSGLLNLSKNAAADFQPTWLDDSAIFSSGGERIAFTSNRDGNQEIYIMNLDGTEQINISNNPAEDFSPNATRSGDRIVFVSTREGNQDVYIMYADGSSQGNLTNHPAQDTLPAWSPDAGWITFTSDRDGNLEIYVMMNNGAEVYNLTQNPAQDLAPGWR
jgi:hypothetical protein